MRRLYFSLFFISLFSFNSLTAGTSFAQNQVDEYFVYFTDKNGVSFNPEEYFHPLAIERRVKNNIDLYDYSDLPLREDYLKYIKSSVDSVSFVSRWFNAVFVYADEKQIERLKDFKFVEKVEKLEKRISVLADYSRFEGTSNMLNSDQVRLMNLQTRHLNAAEFSERRINGTGIRIAVFDAGFPGVNTHEAFNHLISEKRIVGSWDFHNDIANVFKDNAHGTNVLSTIAGYYDTIPLGLATGAEFLLARTEMWLEKFYEEKYWLAAAEWADKNGAHIINSSLGYTYHRYFPEQMDGKTSLVARTATMAARKGILVVVSAGNEGSSASWRTICTPADADSVLSVGALDPNTFLASEYSSRGPTTDWRIKPNLSAIGTVLAAGENAYSTPSGTSFASPMLAGFAACVMQINPDWNNIKVMEEMQKSTGMYPYFDYAHGYGVPDANYFLGKQFIPQNPTFKFIVDDEKVNIDIIDLANYDINNDLSKNILYAHIVDKKGRIVNYFVIDVYQQNAFSLDYSQIPNEHKLVVHYKAYTEEFVR